MRIGIVIGNISPTEGGAYTFFETIKKEILVSQCKHEIYFLYWDWDKVSPGHISEHGIRYINIAYVTSIQAVEDQSFKARLKRKILKKLRLYTSPIPPAFNDIVCNEKIDLLWLLGPFRVETTIPYVFTIWDLGHRLFPCFPEMNMDGLKWQDREETYQKMVYRATYIIAGNETGKKEILTNYPMSPDKIQIIPFPISEFIFEEAAIQDNLNIRTPYVFYPAQFWPHKNHVALIEAIAWLRDNKETIINCYLVGSDKGNLKYILEVVQVFRLENQIFVLGFVENSVLVYLYKNALAMTYVSLLGPNNLPPLEALVLGCPLIISNIPGHLEQVGGTAIEVDAKNPIKIGEAIYDLYKNPEIRKNYIDKGLVFMKKYKKFSYFEKMQEIIDSYDILLKTWNSYSRSRL
jgi:glycosyltransferase involved in cell wall biosynthesis